MCGAWSPVSLGPGWVERGMLPGEPATPVLHSQLGNPLSLLLKSHIGLRAKRSGVVALVSLASQDMCV